jgi:outer membrane protein assembly factor BamE (lipoprotein component of BamABCDE complex)
MRFRSYTLLQAIAATAILIIVGLGILLLIASDVTPQGYWKYYQIRNGMTQHELIEFLGQPPEPWGDGYGGWRFYYSLDGAQIVVRVDERGIVTGKDWR